MLRLKQHYMVASIAAAVVVLLAGWDPAVLGQTPASPDGKELFAKRCGGCHALDRDKEGPRLGMVYGRTAGTVDSFQYSDALKKSGIQWTEETLDRWLTDPARLVPDNDMTFQVQKADERAEIIAYLKRSSQ